MSMTKKYILSIILLVLVSVFFSARFFGVSLEKKTGISLNSDERAWLNKHQNTIRITADPVFLPVSQIEKGQMTGMLADYSEKMEKILGIRFVVVSPPDFAGSLKMARNNEVDIISGVAKTPDRSEYLLFSQPVIKYPAVIAVRKDFKGTPVLSEMKHMKICVGKGFAVIDYLKREYPGHEFREVPDEYAGLLEVEQGLSDAIITDLIKVSYLIKQKEFGNIKVAGEIGFSYALAFASVKTEPLLNSIIIKALDLISEKEKEAIFNKWVSLDYSSNYLKYRTFYLVLLLAVSVIFLLVLFYSWNRMLKLKVNRKTLELSEKQARLDTEIRLRTADLSLVNEELKKAIAEINTLEGFIPICTVCKKIRTDQQFWESVEKYVSNHSDVMFEASLCPKCEEKFLRSGSSALMGAER